MAVEGDVQNEVKSHVQGYESFTAMMKWGAVAVFIIGAIVILLIAN
jgi:hypothetical protein